MAKIEPILRVKNLKKYFPIKKSSPFAEQQYVKANDGVTFEILKGESLGLVGESGCGKSTLGRTLLQLYPQTGGATFYYGKSLEDIAPDYVFKTIKNLKRDVETLEQNREQRRKYKSALETAQTDKEKKEATLGFEKYDKKIDDYFDTTVKIFGGLVFSEDLDLVSKKTHDAYNLRNKIIKSERSLNLFELEKEALIANQGKDSKIEKVKKSITEIKQNLEVLQKDLDQVNQEIDLIKKEASKHEKFERYESRLDSGIDLARLTDEEMRLLRTDLQIIFQDPYSSLNPRMTIGQLIGEALITHGYFKADTDKLNDYIIEIMTKCGLQSYMIHRYPHEFSGGQRQRIGIARALALNPKFVVCDEAVSALDVSIQSQIINLLKDLRDEQGFAYLFISHDLGVVKYISDRIGVMYLGNLVELAESSELFEHTIHPYTQALLKAIPTTERRESIVPLEGDVPSPVNPPSGCKFHTRCPFAKEICSKSVPEWREIRDNHFVACHFAEEFLKKS